MELGARKLKILQAVIEAYIQTGEPVGSKALCELLDVSVSSATIRNEMASLSELGLLEQPHTSAGRIPTQFGYRLYINELMKPKPLSDEEMRYIDGYLSEYADDPDLLLEKAAEMLAEMTKYAANAMLATRISFMNDIANLCDRVGADVEMVRKGIGSDARIGNKFLYPGCGYGGSCFPKDVKALAHTAREHGYTMQVIEAVERVNEQQKGIVFEKLQTALGDLRGKVVAIWGLAFKPETDDMREAPATVVIDHLLNAGAKVCVYDPVAMPESQRRMAGRPIRYARTMYEAAEGADAVALITEWKEFRMPDWAQLYTAMRGETIVDGRNIFDKPEVIAAGFRYFGIGK